MRRKIILVLILLVLPVVVWGDEYVLVMSKEDNVCQHMLGLYNEDLRKYGKIQYDEHEAFTVIKWEEKKYYTTYPDGKKHYIDDGSVLMSRFDINNDGKEEIVLKFNQFFKRDFADSLYFFKSEYLDYFKDEVDVNGLYLKATGKMGTMAFKANVYQLKELPKALLPAGPGYPEAKFYYSLGGLFFINPFLFKGNYYIDMKDDTDIEKWLVILKYTKDNQLKDICYYLKAVNCKNKNQRRK